LRPDADLLVIGGGVAALAAAITAARAGIDTVLLGRKARVAPELIETLAPQALPLLVELGLDRALVERTFPRVRMRLSRWGIGPARRLPENFSLSGGALMLGKARLAELLRALAQAAGAHAIEAGRIQSAREADDAIELEVRNPSPARIRASFVIDATGRTAAFARSLGVRRRLLDALVSFWIEGPAGSEGYQSIATVTVRDGWLFYAGRADGGAALGFFTAASAVRDKPSAAALLDRLAFAPELAPMMADIAQWGASAVVTRNAATTILGRCGGARWLACGDALQTVDPIASHGVATALRQGIGAARVAMARLAGDRDLHRDYEARCLEDFRDFMNRRRAYYGGGG
jgi:flavin-dependent dehydrogenase